MANDGIIRTSIVVDNTSVKSMMQSIKELKAAVADLKADKGKAVMFNGELAGVKELQAVIKQLQGDVKALKANPGKSNALDGLDSGIKETQSKLGTLQKQLRDIQVLKDAAFQAKNIPEQSRLGALETAKYRELMAYQSTLSKTNIEARERTALAADKRYYDEQNRRIKENSRAIQEQMNAQVRAQAQQGSYQGYARSVAAARQEAERLHQIMTQNNTTQTRLDFKNARDGLQHSIKLQDGFNRSIGVGVDRVGMLGSFSQKLRSHFNWILAGSLIAAFAVIPAYVEDIAKETEALGSKMKQNLELAERYKDNMQGLDSDIRHLSEVATTFAIGYGANVKDVMEMMQVLSRRFKSPEELTYYTNLALTMSTLDFVAPKKAAEDLEAVILSMGLDFKESKTFVDQFSVAVHTARITGTNLLTGLQRSGSGFKNMNMGTAEAIALISTLSTVTAKAGANVGVSLSSLITNVDFKKGAEALEEYGIKVYDTSGKMRKGVEVWREMAAVFNGLKADDNDEKANRLAVALSGGKFRINDFKAIMDNWQEFEKIYKDITDKASPELTASLLRTGMDNYKKDVERLSASMQVLGMTIGSELLPMLKSMVTGLTAGVMYLNDNKEAVAGFVKAIEYMGMALLAWRAKNILCNLSLVQTALGIMGIVSTKAEYVTAMGLMGTATMDFAKKAMAAVAMAMGKFLLLYATIQVAGEAMRQFGDKSGLYTQQATAQQEFQSAQYGLTQLEANKSRMSPEDYETARKNLGENIIDKANKVNELNAKVEAKDSTDHSSSMDKYMQKADSMVNLATMNMPSGHKKTQYDKVEGKDISGSSKGDKADPKDTTAKTVDKLDLHDEKRRLNEILHNAKLADDTFKGVFNSIKTYEDVNGEDTYSIIESMKARSDKVKLLSTQNESLEAAITGLEASIDTHIATNAELESKLSGSDGKLYSAMTAKEKRYQRSVNSDLLSNDATLSGYIGLRDKAKEKVSSNNVEITTLNNDNLVAQKNRKILEIYDDAIARNNIATSLNSAKADNKLDLGNDVLQNRIKYNGLLANQEIYNDKIMYYEEQLRDAENKLSTEQDEGIKTALENRVRYLQDSLDKQKLISQENANAIEELEYQKNAKIREGLAGIAQELITEGASLKNIWNKLWTGLANDAIKALFKIQNGSGGLLASIAGLFGGSSSSKTTKSSSYGSTQKSLISSLLPTGFAFADGGITDRPVYGVFGEDGEEANINLAKLSKGDQRQKGLLSYANSKLGTQVEANISQKTMDTARAVSQNSAVSREHITELQRSNSLMSQQLSVLTFMAQQGQTKGNTGSQVVVMPTTQTNEALYSQINSMKSEGYNI